MLIPVATARAILGREADRLSDEEVSRLCRELEDYARLLVRLDGQAQRARIEQTQAQQGAA